MEPIAIRPLSKFLTEKAAEEINEVSKRIPSDLESLKDWLRKQPHLIARTDEQFLISFLRGCKHSLERSKEKIDLFYTSRTTLPEFFTNRDPNDPDFIELFSKGMLCPVPIPHPKGPRIFVCRPGVFDVERHGVTGYTRYFLMIADRNFEEDDYMAVFGVCLLFDMSGFTTKHMAQLTVSFLRKVADIVTGCYPVRYSGFHLINFPVGLDALVAIVKAFLPLKLAERIHFHSNLDSLYKHIPKCCLPVEYGGDAGTLAEITSNFADRYLSDTKWFIVDSKYRCDESKRHGAPKTAENLFGMDGSFRKLQID